MHAEVTMHVLLGCKSPGCPAGSMAAVGTTWGASKLGGPNIKKCLQRRKIPLLRSRFSRSMREADLIYSWGRPMIPGEETGKCTLGTRRRRGPSIQGRIRRDNVGNIPLAAGADRNLQGLRERG